MKIIVIIMVTLIITITVKIWDNNITIKTKRLLA